MNLHQRKKLCYTVISLLFAMGTFQAFRKGGQDFLVFHHASQLSLQGLGQEIYTNSPDRYLYAPGFAWLMAPFALLPFKVSMIFWCLMKAAAFGATVRVLARRFSVEATLLGVLFFARPLLNELRYGQVNLLIACLFVWALDVLLSNQASTAKKIWSWLTFSIAAVAKLFPAVLICIPFLPYRRANDQRLGIRLGIFLGLVSVAFIPILTEGLQGTWTLYLSWREALLSKGFPTETHNQSFLAFLFHSFSGDSFYSLMRGPTVYDFTWFTLPKPLLYKMGMVWSLGVGLCLMLGCYLTGVRQDFRLGLIVMAASILPSHLVWKPYFVFAIPLAAYVAHVCLVRKKGLPLFLLGIGLVNLTSFDFIGRPMASVFEAHALSFWIVVVLVVVALRAKKPTSVIAF